MKARKDCNPSHLISSEFPEIEEETERNAQSLQNLELDDFDETTLQLRGRQRRGNKDLFPIAEMKNYLKVWTEIGRLVKEELLEKKARRALNNHQTDTRPTTPLLSSLNNDRTTPVLSNHYHGRNYIGVLSTGNETTVQFGRRPPNISPSPSRPGSSLTRSSDCSMADDQPEFIETNEGNIAEIIDFN